MLDQTTDRGHYYEHKKTALKALLRFYSMHAIFLYGCEIELETDWLFIVT